METVALSVVQSGHVTAAGQVEEEKEVRREGTGREERRIREDDMGIKISDVEIKVEIRGRR